MLPIALTFNQSLFSPFSLTGLRHKHNCMKSIFLFAALLLVSTGIFSQENGRRMKLFKAVVFHDGKKMDAGYLASLSDTVLKLVPEAAAVNRPTLPQAYHSYH